MGEEAAKKINLLSSKKDKLCVVKSTMSFKPSSSMAPTKILRSASSSFQVWKNRLDKKSHDDHADEGHNNPQSELQLRLPKTCYVKATSSKINIVGNPILDQAKKNIINVSFATPDAAGVNLINTNQNCESRAGKSICLDHNLGITGEDPKILKRLTNRTYAKKYRLKKANHIIDLEKTKRDLTTSINKTRYEIQQDYQRRRALLIEHHQLRLQLATLERNRLLKEVEMENNMEEMQRLKGLQTKQQVSVASSSSTKPN